MTTLLTLTDWLAGLNRWQMTGVSVTALALFWCACACLTALFVRGGYRDNCEDEEDTK